MVAFLLSAVLAPVFTSAPEASAQTINLTYDNPGYFISVTSEDSIDLSLMATQDGGVAISDASTITVKTNAPLGYKLYLSAEDNELRSTTTDRAFKPVKSTTLTDNTWGFSTTGLNNSWLAVPKVTSGNESSGYLLANKNEPSATDGDNINIYYGIRGNMVMPTGEYTATVTYTAIGEGVPEAHSMQEFTTADCANMPTDQTFYLVDARDNNVYSAVHARDGNCWMTQNLRLDGGITLTSSDTNLPSGTTIYLPENRTEGYVFVDTEMDIIRNKEGYDGNFYNWCAATLNNTNCSTTTAEATQDICPKGWQLPTASGSQSFPNLFKYYGLPTSNVQTNYMATLTASPLSFSNSGFYELEVLRAQGERGFYTTKSLTPNATPYNLSYGSTYTYPLNTYQNKINGLAVRCVFK